MASPDDDQAVSSSPVAVNIQVADATVTTLMVAVGRPSGRCSVTPCQEGHESFSCVASLARSVTYDVTAPSVTLAWIPRL